MVAIFLGCPPMSRKSQKWLVYGYAEMHSLGF